MKSLLLIAQVIQTSSCTEIGQKIDNSKENTLYNPGSAGSSEGNDNACPFGYHRVIIYNILHRNEKICVRDPRYNCSEYSNELGMCNHCFTGYYLVRIESKRKACYNENTSLVISGVTIGVIVGLQVVLIILGVCCCCSKRFRVCCCNCLFCCCRKKKYVESNINDPKGKYAQMM